MTKMKIKKLFQKLHARKIVIRLETLTLTHKNKFLVPCDVYSFTSYELMGIKQFKVKV